MKKASFRELAKLGNVSTATVSRVARGEANVDPEMRLRVRQAADRLGIDLEERKHQKSTIIAFILGNRTVLHHFQARVLWGAENYCSSQNKELLFVSHRYPASVAPKELHLPQILTQRALVRAVILGGTHSANMLHALREREIPFAVLGNNVIGPWTPEDYDAVYSDDVQGAFDLTARLIGEGHRDIWFIGDTDLAWYARWANGYRESMNEAGLQPRYSEIHSDDRELGHLAMRSILSRREPVTAVMAGSDQIAQATWVSGFCYNAPNNRLVAISKFLPFQAHQDVRYGGIILLRFLDEQRKELQMTNNLSRRAFVAGSLAALPFTARSYDRIVGANDRIQIGAIGCGHRSRGHRAMLKQSFETDPKFDVRSVCDLWTLNRERAAADVEHLFGAKPKTFKYSEEMLADKDLDAVMIATGDHQHARILAEVVRAGKDCYCEKPMANTLEDAKLARDTVKASKQVVQMGSQWLSDPYQQRVREIVRSGKLGKIVSISQSWNFNGPRWDIPKSEDIAALREQDTDWNRWLLGRGPRAFDPRVYFEFRIFKQFSGGITDQWYSHGSGLAHFYLDTFIPDDTVSNGGIFAWHDVRENPDTFQCVSTFGQKEVLYSYSTTFGNGYGDHTIIRGKHGTLYSPGGEGSPQWWFQAETYSGWGSNVVFDLKTGKAKPELVTIPGHSEVPPVDQDDNLKYHTDDWFRCMRNRKTPNGSIDSGFAHAVAVVMATRSFREGKKMYWDRKNELILDHPPA